MSFKVIASASLVAAASAHGYLSSPRSRTQLAFENREDYCPQCTLENVPALPLPSGRNYPGYRPFAEPGDSPLTMGPCGLNGNNYNMPDKSWGNIVDEFTAGDVIEFDSCWTADHKGAYSLRLCQDEALVAPFLDSSRAPTAAEMTRLEDCFKAGILPCANVESNLRCDATPATGCQEGWGCWDNTDWFYTERTGAQNQGTCGSNNSFYTRDAVQLPQDFSSNHTLLSWRWDALDTAQLYTSCSDVSILPSGPPTPAPPTNPPTNPPPTNPPTLAPPTMPPTSPPPPCAADWQTCSAGQECCNANFDCKAYQGTMSCSP